jgi:hypothetical protein
MKEEYEILNNLYNESKVYYEENDILDNLAKKGIVYKLSNKQRYDLWFINNYETGMEPNFNENKLVDYTKDTRGNFDPIPLYTINDPEMVSEYLAKLKRNLNLNELGL